MLGEYFMNHLKLTAILVAAFCLCACNHVSREKQILGTWEAEFVGSRAVVVFAEDHTYTSTVYVVVPKGSRTLTDTGTWKIAGKNLLWTIKTSDHAKGLEGHTIWQPIFRLRDNVLVLGEEGEREVTYKRIKQP